MKLSTMRITADTIHMILYNNDPDIQRVVDQLVDGTYANGDTEMYRDLYNSSAE